MKEQFNVFRRGFTIVFITAINVVLLSTHHLTAAIVTGGILSWVWWGNAHQASAHNTTSNRLAYALGAALGTGVGLKVTEIATWLLHQR